MKTFDLHYHQPYTRTTKNDLDNYSDANKTFKIRNLDGSMMLEL